MIGPGVHPMNCCCCCAGSCCGGWNDNFDSYPDGVPPDPPWGGLLGDDPGQIVSGKLWGADQVNGSVPGRTVWCEEDPLLSYVYHVSFTLRGGGNGGFPSAGVLSGALGAIAIISWTGVEWEVNFGGTVVWTTGNTNTEGVVVDLLWNSNGAWQATVDGVTRRDSIAPFGDVSVFAANLPNAYNAVDPTAGDWVDDVTAGCEELACGYTETWAYPAGPAPDPPWTSPFGPGFEIVATGAGTATSGAGPSVGTRARDAFTWGYTGSVTIDDPNVVSWATITNAGLVSQLGVTWDLGAGGWGVLGPGGGGLSGHVGASATFTFQWNAAGDWSVTIGAEPPMTGVGMPDVTGGFLLLYAPGAAPSSTFGPITSICEELVP